MKNRTYQTIQNISEQFTESIGHIDFAFQMIVWGQSAQGKSNFVLQFTKELLKSGDVLYVSLEEGHSLTMQRKVIDRLGEVATDYTIRFADHQMTYSALIDRLSKKRKERFVIIDSLQYWNIDYNEYKALKEKFAKKSFIFISHSKGKIPDGKTADKIRYDAGIKIRVEGFIAFCASRYGGNRNFVIWEQGARRYWGKDYQKMTAPAAAKKQTKKSVPPTPADTKPAKITKLHFGADTEPKPVFKKPLSAIREVEA